MHLKNDNEMNSSTNGNISAECMFTKPITASQSDFSATSARDSVIITPATSSSADSCASSTDFGVIITDNNTNNYDSLQTYNVDNIITCNGTSGNTVKDNNTATRSRSAEGLKTVTNKNATINNEIDSKSINIENVINIDAVKNMRRQRNSVCSRISSKTSSPAVSIRSNTISIISIDENAIDSSVVDSDSDSEGQHSGYVVKKLGQQTTYEPNHPNLPHINKGLQVLSQTISPGVVPPTAGPLSETILNGGGALSPPILAPPLTPNAAQIGSIALSNSTDVTFGDKHFYEGPVTIQQFLIDSREKWKNGENGGNDNPAFSEDGKGFDSAEKVDSSPTQPQGPKFFIFKRRALIITGAIILLTILIGIVIVTVNTLTKQTKKSKPLSDGDDSRKHIPINSTIELPLPDSEYIFNGSLLIITKDEWYAEAQHEGVEELKWPAQRVIIAHTASTSCENKLQCDARAQSVQAFHIHSNGWGDIGYNFLVGGNGLVYEGRGWNNVGAHTKGYNRGSICIAFIGTFNAELPTENDLKAAQLLIDEGLRLGALSKDYRLYGARQLSPTESPGKALYNIIMKWPHWASRI
ncbi:peptidoglycan-recognition protein LC isoform X1 [Ceratitis capitata]|uniref:peptidoglycan-recognition protein LC isoform X1 n=1 Tax=Ceratitis capitata TaxID=7213 RepID=UPI000A121A93|nr:peptidoglycan-recognition protein LC isoform X1 [Ceratitis capitata]XP_020715824.1 peptidoglycan-recognition protein LC isoform X1 [Ceratitis capitata]XP_020715825.1 peptidoglycan-recognition protein LC isoform X1 [Ceratitis capitata]XP_020715826.1 peptidoglycan-recognition protein LC isoform X1 [Ceratitis capitata]XP_020715827.1 peptidoglycan-recognition protein LC isoform X1 [Ceratitis capitata]